ncbi:hypothetical protein QBC40DRAFT_268889 [Triangularia verruculosa]|uniref:Uncharacterized protein n=1 Tax=Triangularia verruculosa TaxID=2587418 RepID=A0AAN7AQT1_9PEZI|nr:hypothetical protein QBC40DRAFT_268889 [Triangularia verruculosa]
MSVTVPPVTNDHWSYAHGEFFVEVSGHNLHRRATIPEIRTQFEGTPDSSKDRPAHWYEAQLVHLPPSKNKDTAKMRLYEALNGGKLAVPREVLKVEADLKKEWTKRDREAKQAHKNQSTTTNTAKGGTKRKATDDNAHPGSGSTTTAKKARTIATPKPKAAPKPAAEPAPAKKQTARRGGSSASTASSRAVPSQPAPSAPEPTKQRTKQTARCSRGRGGSQAASSSSRPAPAPSSSAPKPSRPIQTARRVWNGPIGGHTKANNPPQYGSTPSAWDSYTNHNDDPPPPYPGSPTYLNLSPARSPPLPPLGLLNGRYELQTEDPAFRSHDSGMILTLDGDALWGSFELGPLTGIWLLETRPYQSSHERLYIQWNGRMVEFVGRRVSGRGETRSEVSAFEMRTEWAERGLMLVGISL